MDPNRMLYSWIPHHAVDEGGRTHEKDQGQWGSRRREDRWGQELSLWFQWKKQVRQGRQGWEWLI